MQIILGKNKVVAGPVTHWEDILNDANEMKDMIDSGNFFNLRKEGYALAHSQVSLTPKAFFVVDKTVARSFGGSRIIANTKILHKTNPVSFKEGCLSFPHRPQVKTKRFDKITIECEIGENSPMVFDLEGLEAYIVQHEIDHAKGINIYHK